MVLETVRERRALSAKRLKQRKADKTRYIALYRRRMHDCLLWVTVAPDDAGDAAADAADAAGGLAGAGGSFASVRSMQQRRGKAPQAQAPPQPQPARLPDETAPHEQVRVNWVTPLTPAEERELAALEERLTVDEILHFRVLAEAELEREHERSRQRERRERAAQAATTGSSWWWKNLGACASPSPPRPPARLRAHPRCRGRRRAQATVMTAPAWAASLASVRC